ncbi:MAG: DNA polymerase Y family protein [Candidatus Acidiferrales bacterium]
MSFACVYVPNFMVQAVVRGEPDLRDRALALVEGDPPLWKIVAANEAALQAGIQLGMGGSQAKQFGGVEIRHRSQAQEKAAHAALLDVGWSASPRVEDTAPDTVVLDLAGLTSIFESVKKFSAELAERVTSIGLHPHLAVASNIEVAIPAARGFGGITLIPPGEELKHLSCLPVEVLLPGAEILETLHRWGIRTCGALAALPVLQLSERLGQEGVRLHELACGTYCRSIELAVPEISFEEEIALDYTVTELEPLTFLLGRLLNQVCARLEARSLAASAFCLRFGLKDSVSMEEEFQTVKRASARAAESTTYEKILRLPVPMRDPKTLLKLLRLQLQNDPPHGSIVKIILAAEPARTRAGQKGLFVPDAPAPEKLEVTIARLAGLVGNSNVGTPELVNSHRPGEFRMVPFFIAPEESNRSRKAKNASSELNGSNSSINGGNGHETQRRRATIAFRRFRPDVPANVESQQGCPCRICFRGMRGDVISASGPWRTSGGWWEEQGWRQDEWDVEIRFDLSSNRASNGVGNGAGTTQSSRLGAQSGLYRIYYDWVRRGWFVRGRYD